MGREASVGVVWARGFGHKPWGLDKYGYNEGYVTGVAVIKRIGDTSVIKLMDIKLAQKGFKYLQDDSKMSQAQDFLKGITEIIPGI